jgi:hypothetical protein
VLRELLGMTPEVIALREQGVIDGPSTKPETP